MGSLPFSFRSDRTVRGDRVVRGIEGPRSARTRGAPSPPGGRVRLLRGRPRLPRQGASRPSRPAGSTGTPSPAGPAHGRALLSREVCTGAWKPRWCRTGVPLEPCVGAPARLPDGPPSGSRRGRSGRAGAAGAQRPRRLSWGGSRRRGTAWWSPSAAREFREGSRVPALPPPPGRQALRSCPASWSPGTVPGPRRCVCQSAGPASV